MAMTLMRFNMVQPGLEPAELSSRHKAMLDMCGHGDTLGMTGASLEEHHGAENGWSPSPLILAGLIFGRTQRMTVSISAILLPLHDPLRVAEDIAVLDLASGGRLTVIFGLGYRPSEYAAHGKDWKRRGKLMDEAVEAVLNAWKGEPFAFRDTTLRVTPSPVSRPHPMVMLGGTSPAAVKRAARFGLPFFSAKHAPDLEPIYYDACKEHGTQGFFMGASPDTSMIHIAEDPDRAWATIGHHYLHEAVTYTGWQTPDIRSSMKSRANTVQELRDEGIYKILTPEQCLERARGQGAAAQVMLHPLCGGMPIDEGWANVQLFTDKVLPHLP